MQFERIEVEKIKQNNLELRKNTLSLAPLMKSISEYGFIQPIIVNQDNIVVDGNNRLQAAIKLGYTVLPVIKIDISEQALEQYALIHSQIQELTGWNFALKKSLVQKHNIDTGAYGMSDEMRQIDDIDEFFTEEDAISLF
ncbi:MAG: ParB N-terminal domain-containing protein [Bacteroidales bacterium]|nr:ParB N-terminal domain-containing protein [Candidatus Scybalousia scybalohippi]